MDITKQLSELDIANNQHMFVDLLKQFNETCVSNSMAPTLSLLNRMTKMQIETKKTLSDYEKKVASLESELAKKDKIIKSIDDLIDTVLNKFNDVKQTMNIPIGSRLYVIDDVINALNTTVHITLPPLFTDSNGYKISGYLSLNDATGYRKHIGLYLKVEKGPHDDKLIWPMRNKVFKFSIINRITETETVRRTFRSNVPHLYSSFCSPDDSTPAGIKDIVSKSHIKDTPGFIINNKLFIQFNVLDELAFN